MMTSAHGCDRFRAAIRGNAAEPNAAVVPVLKGYIGRFRHCFRRICPCGRIADMEREGGYRGPRDYQVGKDAHIGGPNA